MSHSDWATGETFRWLDGDDQQDLRLWHELWKNSDARRPHDHPGFLRAMGAPGDQPTAVSYQHQSGGSVLYPFYRRCLTQLPFCQDRTEPLLHLVSPYGYGGPLYQGGDDLRHAVSEGFESRFQEAAQQRGVVSEFIREDLFPERLAVRCQGEHLPQQPNVVVRLDRDPEDIWQHYHPKVRKNVNRARQQGLRVVFDPDGTYLDQFLEVYHQTMTRTGAAGGFFFPRQRFEELADSLGRDGGLMYVHVFDGEMVVSTELLLLAADTIYSFLGGTIAAAFEKRPNDLLKHEVILWGRGGGYRHYVLGGGIEPGDGMFLYKKAFDPSGVVPFFVRRIQHDQLRYANLVAWRHHYEGRRGIQWHLREHFFPLYLS